MTYEAHLAAGEKAAQRYVLAIPHTRVQGLGGKRLGRRSGSSLDFLEHRDYQPGDDLRHLDWSAYARSDRLVVKLFHEEVDPHLDLLIDGSRSMALQTETEDAATSPKAAATAGLAALVAQAAVHAGFSYSSWLAADGCSRLGRSGERPIGWQTLYFAHSGCLADAFVRLDTQYQGVGRHLLTPYQ